MNTIRIHKKIESNDIHIDGLDRFKGRNAEIVVLIDDDRHMEQEERKNIARDVINSFTGKIHKWNRNDLHGR